MAKPVLYEYDRVKIFVLYLLDNIRYPLDFVSINDIVMQNGYVEYIDFAQCFHKMVDDGLIAEEKAPEPEAVEMYRITSRGRQVSAALSGDLYEGILTTATASAMQYLDFKRRGIKVESAVRLKDSGRYELNCSITEAGDTIFSLVIDVDSEQRARKMASRFRENSEVIYRGAFGLIEGKIDYILK